MKVERTHVAKSNTGETDPQPSVLTMLQANYHIFHSWPFLPLYDIQCNTCTSTEVSILPRLNSRGQNRHHGVYYQSKFVTDYVTYIVGLGTLQACERYRLDYRVELRQVD